LLVAAGAYVSRRVRRAGDFFVAGRSLSGGLVFVTLLAANIGAGSTVGATGLGYQHGLSAWWWSGSAAIGCLVLGLVVAPRMQRLAAERGLLTVGDYLEWRFDRSVRGLVAAILWLGTLAILAGQLIAMAWALDVVLGLPKAVGMPAQRRRPRRLFQRRRAPGRGLGQPPAAGRPLGRFPPGRPVRRAGGRRMARDAGRGRRGSRLRQLHGHGLGRDTGSRRHLRAVVHRVARAHPEDVRGADGGRRTRGGVGQRRGPGLFAFIPPLLGMAARVLRPGLSNPELALPSLMTMPEALPPWLGGLALAALFAAEISTADAVLFMLATSLSQDLYKSFLNPAADDRRLLRVSRWTSVAAGALGVGLAILLPTVVDA
jgi:SSS family solute:Na+ symporter